MRGQFIRSYMIYLVKIKEIAREMRVVAIKDENIISTGFRGWIVSIKVLDIRKGQMPVYKAYSRAPKEDIPVESIFKVTPQVICAFKDNHRRHLLYAIINSYNSYNKLPIIWIYGINSLIVERNVYFIATYNPDLKATLVEV